MQEENGFLSNIALCFKATGHLLLAGVVEQCSSVQEQAPMNICVYEGDISIQSREGGSLNNEYWENNGSCGKIKMDLNPCNK